MIFYKYFFKATLLFLLPLNAMAQYPTATGNNNDYEYISNVSFSNINNTTADADDDGNGDDSYDYYPDQIAYVNTGKTIQLSVTISPDANDYVYAWIDWNKDNTFNNTNERYILASNTSSAGPFTTNIIIPTTASTGQTRMRVVLAWNKVPTSTGSQTYGEVEDYIINVSKYNYVYFGGWDANGLPDYLETTNDIVTQETRDLISITLPETTPNLDYIDYNDYLNVTVDTGTKIWASFIYEGAGWKNSFAMYQYLEINPPSTTSDIDSLTIIFPNVAGTGSGVAGGGSLLPGHKVYYDSVAAGTTVAFAVIAQGFDLSHTTSTLDNQGAYIHYSNNNLNRESVDSLKAHNVTFWDSNQEKYILGFEDIDRELSSCDQDFNDVLFYITLDPIPDFSSPTNSLPPDIEDPEGSTLPVEWLGFEGKSVNNQVVLHWFIASQQNNDYFIIERSLDMVNFEPIGKVNGHGTTNQLIRYTYIDEKPLDGESYYRIKQIDYDGSIDYSIIISVDFHINNGFIAIYPNPLKDDILNIRAEGLDGDIHFEIINSVGKIVITEDFNVRSDFTKKVNLNNLANGLYFIKLSNSYSTLEKKLIINR